MKFDQIIKRKQQELEEKIKLVEPQSMKSNRFNLDLDNPAVRNRIISINSLNKSLITYTKEIEEILNKELDFNNYEIGKVLGFGSYAVVRLGTHKQSGALVAIKTYEKKNLKDPMKLKNV